MPYLAIFTSFYLFFFFYLARNVQPQMTSVMAGWSERAVLFECFQGFHSFKTFQTSVLEPPAEHLDLRKFICVFIVL